MSLPLFFGVLTLAPAVAALLIACLGLAKRPIARIVWVLTWLGALIPLAALIYLVADLASGVPQRVTVIGPAGLGTWLSLAYRYDAYAVYGAFGVAVVVAPLLLWMVVRGGATADEAEREAEDAAEEDRAEGAAEAAAEGELPAPGATATGGTPAEPWLRQRSGGEWVDQLLPQAQWAGFAVALALESAALVLCFADSLVWLAVAWVALAALAWGLGEIGAAPADLDRRSLPLMLAGPILWLVAMLVIGSPTGSARLSDLAGLGGASIWLVLAVCVFLALAGGAYPFNGWVRRRAMVTPPAGFAAVMLAALPAALFAGGRTYAALQDVNNLWPQLGAATPPITIAIVLVLLGALTVAICGLLALNFRDGRTLVALLATAQVGWGLLALGIGRPLSAAALVALLATMVFGLGALIAALFVGGMLTSGEEPEGAGPQPFDAPRRPLLLATWLLGVTALLGAPLFGGFIARQLISAASLTAAQLTIPLTGLAWVGDALLAFALARATAPALFAKPAPALSVGLLPGLEPEAPTTPVVQPAEALSSTSQGAAPPRAGEIAAADELEVDEVEIVDEDVIAAEDELPEEADEAETEEEAGPPRRPWAERLRDLEPAELAGLVLALLALVIGIAPTLLFLVGGLRAAQALLQPGALDAPLFQLQPLGYIAGPSQWLPTLVWIAVVILGILAALIREISRPAARVAAPTAGELAAQSAEGLQPAPVTAAAPLAEEPTLALASFPEPGDTWKDLAATFDSGWTVPGVDWLLHDLEGDETADQEDDVVADEALRALREAGRRDVLPPGVAEDGEPDEDDNPQAAGTRGEGTSEQP